ncbi:hypothetical protein AAC387_Pa03g1120 [Persea americana]
MAPKDNTSEEYETWEDENCMVKSWLLDAMTKDIRSLFLRLSTAKEIWEAAKKTYSVSQGASKAYQLYCEVISVHQNGGSVISYFEKLQKLWQEFDAIESCTMECTLDIERYTTMVNSQRLYVFLAGLDSHLDGVCGHVLAITTLPNLQVAYSIVCAEANRQDAMLGVTSNEGAVMAIRKSRACPDPKKGVCKCTHCNGDNHVIDTCFKLHGYPDWHPKGKMVSPRPYNLTAKGSVPKSHLVTASGFVAKLDFVCDTCVMAKSHRSVFYSRDNKTNAPFALVHSDVWGPAPLSTPNGMKWFITFVDDFTRMTWVYLLRLKSDVRAGYHLFHQMVLTQFGISIKIIRSDNGGEYFKNELIDFLHFVGTIHQTSCS